MPSVLYRHAEGQRGARTYREVQPQVWRQGGGLIAQVQLNKELSGRMRRQSHPLCFSSDRIGVISDEAETDHELFRDRRSGRVGGRDDAQPGVYNYQLFSIVLYLS